VDASSVGCSINGAVVSFTGVGTCVIDANQLGSSNYYAAPQVQQSFPISQAAQSIVFSSPAPDAAFGGATRANSKSLGRSPDLA
jgi:hypothetical protein